MMRKGSGLPGVIFAALVLCCACAPVRQPVPPDTIPEPRSPTISDEQYGQTILSQLQERYQLDYNNPAHDKVTEIVDRLAAAAHAGKQPWHVYLLKDDNLKNAAATRGNHVFIWTGMLSAARSDEELAAVLAHEMAHVISGHTDPDPHEEMRKMLIAIGATAAGIAVSAVTRDPYLGQNLGNLASSVTQGVGSGLIMNPRSRELELEADRVGMLLMAEARYNPEAALSFWERAEKDPTFSASIPFFSTHPPAEERLDNLRQTMPGALARYRGEKPPPGAAALTSGDSFDIRQKESGASPPPADARSELKDMHPWKVVSDGTVLYSSPDRGSRPLGEFRAGAVVQAAASSEKWLEIASPDHGFIERRKLEPASR